MGVDTALGTVSFFSGRPNFAARFASRSSLTPRGAASIWVAFALGCVLGVLGVLGVDTVFVGVGAVRFDVALGSNGIPNLSARALRACCSGVSAEDFAPDELGMVVGCVDESAR